MSVLDVFSHIRNNLIEDYNKHRIEKKLNPITFKLVGVEKVTNPFLQARFDQRLALMKAAGRSGAMCCLFFASNFFLICLLCSISGATSRASRFPRNAPSKREFVC